MYRIKKIKFNNHEILGNLELDFTDRNGKAVDTIIIAGENGVGKSMILNELYSYASGHPKNSAQIVLEIDGQKDYMLTYYMHNGVESKDLWVKDNEGLNTIPSLKEFSKKYMRTLH